ncbi:MAG: hypothetical protein CMC35_09480 [Flavobacteriaceae bacterium]|nr:hypothetical protein [Flavobacteriaceae bacterium]|tara:strand:- start:1311 stop:1832 length:522 start_codon:yes stop_codon:yes gene_type:complete
MLSLEENKHICLDSCSIINLINGGYLEEVLLIPNYVFVIGPSVYDEVSKILSQKEIVDHFISMGKLHEFSDDIDIEMMDSLFSQYNLGDGETESVTMSIENNFEICVDDKSARRMAEENIGAEKTMGSLRLLKFTVEKSLIECFEAFRAYELMINEGGFLPKGIPRNYFCKAS